MLEEESTPEEVISLFDLFKIGIGPSSSHSVGPMVAAKRFVDRLIAEDKAPCVSKVIIELFGSLALTGIGHGTDTALLLGLLGETPAEVDTETVTTKIKQIDEQSQLKLAGRYPIDFTRQNIDFRCHETLPYHPNGMRFKAFASDGELLESRAYYSIGGGFVLSETEATSNHPNSSHVAEIPYPYSSGARLLELGEKHNLSIAEICWQNECALRPEDEVRDGIDKIWQTMSECIARGCKTEGTLPGGLNVPRRAPKLYQKLRESTETTFHEPGAIFDWVNLYALAVNEENASGGRVVTAPTNGAAGIIPAVLNFYCKIHPKGNKEEGIRTFLLTAAAIGVLYKRNASISGADVGCQGEVGVACSMAAGALTAALGGNNYQIENAAEIGMEHSLGLTCDPIGGLVQIPCIERNAMGSIKAINSANLALKGDGTHHVSLDAVIQTMWQTGKDMHHHYKETSLGGLAVSVPNC